MPNGNCCVALACNRVLPGGNALPAVVIEILYRCNLAPGETVGQNRMV
jgi:hypothetical protein